MRRVMVCLGVILVAMVGAVSAVDIHDTRLVHDAAVSANHIAFAYVGDLWVADRDGDNVRRLTTAPGEETNPRFSPDGSLIAFSGSYEGNVDVYVVPVVGGVPRRLTWHPGRDIVQGFTPDGSAVVFTSPRSVFTRRYVQLFTVALAGGMPERIPLPFAFKAAISPDGARIAYVPLREAFREWKNYRGGTASRIWIYDRANRAVEQVPQPEGRCNDTDPMWLGDTLYFISDRAGEFNLYSYQLGSHQVAQLTRHEDFPVIDATAGGGRVIYEQAGTLHLWDPASEASERVPVGVAADLTEVRPRWASGSKWIREAAISPSGARAVFDFRGEIVTVPAEKGDPRDITDTPGANERSPAWSPDGTRIAYFSDQGGEYHLVVAPQDGHGETRSYDLGGSGFYERPLFSPDGTKIAYADNSRTLYWIDLGSGKVTRIDAEPLYGPVNTQKHAWSPDSKWIVYTRLTPSYLQQVCLYSLDKGTASTITEGLADVSDAAFDASGKYLFLAASTDAGPVRDWFSMSNADMELTDQLYLVVLKAGTESPLAKESDEEKGKPAKAESSGDAAKKAPGAGEKAPVTVAIDFQTLHERIVPLPLPAAVYTDLQVGAAGQLYYLKRTGGGNRLGGGAATLCRFDLEKREETVLADGVNGFVVTPDGAKALLQQKDTWRIADTKTKVDPAKGALDVAAIQVRVDPRAEWAQIFNEAWRINRDYFYDPGMHGADWPAMRTKYAQFLPDLATRSDLDRVMQWMFSELSVGHHRLGGGDEPEAPEAIPGGLLGADYEVADGRYRFAKVYGGLNWDPDLRSPLTEPGVEVTAGEYLLEVDGRDLKPPENLFARFENTAGRIVELTVGPDPTGRGSRTVKVVPVKDESALRNRDWVEGNIRKVDQATDGRVAYVYVPNTTGLGHTYFKRYFFPQAQKDAIIVDERHNGGGQVADYYIDTLRRPFIAMWAMRYGADLKTPLASIQGPKVMLIDETAGSGGDLLPWMFHKLGLGTLVGRRTWGGLVGILGFPELMDGGFVTAPNLAIWTEDGWVVESQGVPPDIEVEQDPAQVEDGHDPQLEKAIQVALEGLAAHPPKKLERPPYPVKVRK